MNFVKEWTASTPDHQMAVFSERDNKDGYWKIMKVSENYNSFYDRSSL